MKHNFQPIQWSIIPHYYGDIVRVLFVIIAIMSAFSIPVFGDLVPIGTFTQVVGIVMLVLLAGLTNPHSTTVLWADTIIAAAGVILLENAAISYYSIDAIAIFLVREILVLLLLIALYYSLKTVRAIAQHTLGHSVHVGDLTNWEKIQETQRFKTRQGFPIEHTWSPLLL
jgi:hypothetical protein